MRTSRSACREAGFSLVELVIVVLILGILAAIGVPRYMETLENSKADDAAATLKMIGTANRMYRLDRGSYVDNGKLANACNTEPCKAGPPHPVCNLIACGYLSKQPWDEKPYSFRAGGLGTDCGFGGTNIVACAKRQAPPAPGGTSSTKHQGWGYTMDQDGKLLNHGAGSPPPPAS